MLGNGTFHNRRIDIPWNRGISRCLEGEVYRPAMLLTQAASVMVDH